MAKSRMMEEPVEQLDLMGLAGDALQIEGSASADRQANEEVPAQPRIKSPDRSQMVMRTIEVDRLVAADHPVRAIWELVNRLELGEFYGKIKAVAGMAGRPSWDPRVLISLWVYAYSDGVNAGREIARLCSYHPAYQWLSGLAEINYHTICDFRVENKTALDRLFVDLLAMLMTEGLINLERITQDGVKIKACASSDTFRREEKLRQCLRLAEEHLKELASLAEEEVGRRRAAARARAARERKAALELALAELEQLRTAKSAAEKGEARASLSDPEARKMKQADGGYAPSYNAQINTDAANKIIVAVGITQAGSDFHELEAGIARVEANTGQTPKQVLVDSHYTTAHNIVAMSGRGIELIGRLGHLQDQPGISEKAAAGYRVRDFTYDAQRDIYVCPAEKVLCHKRQTIDRRRVNHVYEAAVSDCQSCPFQPQCCPSKKKLKKGRSIKRSEFRSEVAAFAAAMETEEAKQAYKQRGPVAEFPHAWIKEKFGLRQFRLRGLLKVGMEMLWASLTYNVKRWIGLVWKARLAS